jgi:hypothetical protein
MTPIIPIDDENIDDQTGNFSGHISVPISGAWSERGRINIKQVDPLPMTILSVYPKGVIGE